VDALHPCHKSIWNTWSTTSTASITFNTVSTIITNITLMVTIWVDTAANTVVLTVDHTVVNGRNIVDLIVDLIVDRTDLVNGNTGDHERSTRIWTTANPTKRAVLQAKNIPEAVATKVVAMKAVATVAATKVGNIMEIIPHIMLVYLCGIASKIRKVANACAAVVITSQISALVCAKKLNLDPK